MGNLRVRVTAAVAALLVLAGGPRARADEPSPDAQLGEAAGTLLVAEAATKDPTQRGDVRAVRQAIERARKMGSTAQAAAELAAARERLLGLVKSALAEKNVTFHASASKALRLLDGFLASAANGGPASNEAAPPAESLPPPGADASDLSAAYALLKEAEATSKNAGVTADLRRAREATERAMNAQSMDQAIKEVDRARAALLSITVDPRRGGKGVRSLVSRAMPALDAYRRRAADTAKGAGGAPDPSKPADTPLPTATAAVDEVRLRAEPREWAGPCTGAPVTIRLSGAVHTTGAVGGVDVRIHSDAGDWDGPTTRVVCPRAGWWPVELQLQRTDSWSESVRLVVAAPRPFAGLHSPDVAISGACTDSTTPGAVATRDRFRVSLLGFVANQRTNDGLETDGPGDEVSLRTHVFHVDATHEAWDGVEARPRADPVRGVGTGSAVPTPSPWRRTAPFTANGAPPDVLFEGPLTRGVNAVVIVPTAWELDGVDRGLAASYRSAVEGARPAVSAAVRRFIAGPQTTTLSTWLVGGGRLGIPSTTRLDYGVPADRPIGIRPGFGFVPQALVLTFDAARYISEVDFGTGVRGVVPIRFTEDALFAGDYTLYVQVERDPGVTPLPEPAAPDTVTGTFTYADNENDFAPAFVPEGVNPEGSGSFWSTGPGTFARPIVGCRFLVYRAGLFAFGGDTDANGAFRAEVPHMPDGTETVVVLYATNRASQVLAGFGPYFVRRIRISSGSAPLDFSENLTDPDSIRSFNAAECLRLANDFMRAGRDPAETEEIPVADVSFLRNTGPFFTHYNPFGSGLTIHYALDAKDLVIFHEYAHFLEDKIGSFVVVPSYHDGCFTSQRCLRARDCLTAVDAAGNTQLVNSPENAWMEGFADYFAMAVLRANPTARLNESPEGTLPMGMLENPGDCGALGVRAFDARTITDQMIEKYVASVLWRVSEAPGSDRDILQIFDHDLDFSRAVLPRTLPTLQHFYDAWVTLHPADKPRLDAICGGPAGRVPSIVRRP